MQDSGNGSVAKVTEDELASFVSNLQANLSLLLSTIHGSDLSGAKASEICAHLQMLSGTLSALMKDARLKTAPINQASQAMAKAIPKPADAINQITYCSPAMHDLIAQADKAARSDAPVLITGETGVGKELIARLIHHRSYRGRAAMVPFNCAAVSRELFESHLFGHKHGAFTGALRDNQGVIRASAGSTLLLDEIGELPIELQPKLLRFLQDGEIHTVGQARPSQVDVRVIASTNRNLEDEVDAGRFRADLYYRLNIIRLEVLPLRDRREDIPLLMKYFFNKYSNSSASLAFEPEALERLIAYNWPGNVRELSSLVLRFVTLVGDKTRMDMSNLPPEIISEPPIDLAKSPPTVSPILQRPSTILPTTLAEEVRLLEREKIQGALIRNDWNFARAARHLGLSTFGLRKKYRRLFEEDLGATADSNGNRIDNEVALQAAKR